MRTPELDPSSMELRVLPDSRATLHARADDIQVREAYRALRKTPAKAAASSFFVLRRNSIISLRKLQNSPLTEKTSEDRTIYGYRPIYGVIQYRFVDPVPKSTQTV